MINVIRPLRTALLVLAACPASRRHLWPRRVRKADMFPAAFFIPTNHEVS